MSAIDRTLVLVKPDGVARGLIGQIIARYEAKGLTIRALELRQADAALAAQHYVEHVGRDYYPSSKPSSRPDRWWRWCWRASGRSTRSGH